MTFLIAVVAAAAGAMGPVFYVAARTSILHDGLASASTIGRGVEVSTQGQLPGLLGRTTAFVSGAALGTAADRLLPQRILSLDSEQTIPGTPQRTVLVWRDGACEQLRLVSGRCPSRAREVMASRELVEFNHWRVGESLPLGGSLVGVYTVPDPGSAFWFARGYFPQQNAAAAPAPGPVEPVDALFTTRTSMEDSADDYSGTAVVDMLVDPAAVRVADVSALRETVGTISQRLLSNRSETSVYVQSGVDAVADGIEANWRGLLTPVLLITAQLLVLVWLLLFLVITEGADARASEVALAKLRGFSRWQTMRFGLAEVFALLAAALPAGALAGWGAARLLAAVTLRPESPVALTGAGWAGAGVAVLGGALAAVLAARRTLVRPVLHQWRRTPRQARRGWVVDAVVGTAAAAGLVELVRSGSIVDPGQHVLALLCPGLLGVAVAVTASRLLPAGCGAAYGWSLRHGSIGPFLAIRQVARRPGGARTTIVLATAFALATFALAADVVLRDNIARVAAAEVGAATVLDVVPPAGQRTADIVARLDPSGTQAVAVRQYADLSSPGRRFLAVDPARFAKVATWSDGAPPDPQALQPPAAPPLAVTGEAVRVRLSVEALSAGDGTRLSLGVQSSRAYAETPLDLGPLRKGAMTLTAQLPSCPCTIRSISADGVGQRYARLVVTGIEVRGPAGWRTLDAGLAAGDGWRWQQRSGQPGQASVTSRGLLLTFSLDGGPPPAAAYYSWPDPLPALVTPSVADDERKGPIAATGLGASAVTVHPVWVGVVPGAPANGVVIDQDYAERAAGGLSANVQEQVWLSAGGSTAMPRLLRDAGVAVVGEETTSAQTAAYLRQGPALAIVLFVADAVAAAVLAAAGAVVALHVSGRRRGYEMAALVAAGGTRRHLAGAIRMEQALTLGFGVLLGIATGVAAALLALPTIPELVDAPAAPTLSFTPRVGPVVGLLAAVVLLLALSAELSGTALVRRTRAEALREGPI